MIRVLHLTSGDLKGGASKMALLLHQELLQLQVQSQLLCTATEPTQNFPKTQSLKNKSPFLFWRHRFQQKLDRVWLRAYPLRTRNYFSPFQSGLKLQNLGSLQESFDLIHLHWVCDGLLSMKAFQHLPLPVVWTMHDQFPMTGGCHYTQGCQQFQTGCGRCPTLGSQEEQDLSSQQLSEKQNLFAKIHFVAISTWMQNQAALSPGIPSQNLHRVFNGIDTRVFLKKDALAFRQKHHILPTEKVLLCGAYSLQESRKGFDLLIKTLQQWSSSEKPTLVLFGSTENIQPLIPQFKVISLNYIQDPETLAQAYSGSNLFVSLARQEGFGLAVAEALACGTPTLSLRHTGTDDLIQNSPWSQQLNATATSSDIQMAIESLLRLENVPENLLDSQFTIQRCAQNYKTLYEDILAHQKNSI